MLRFGGMTEAQLRQWVEGNPGRVNDTDKDNCTLLYAASSLLKSLPLVLWLVDVMGADLNTQVLRGQTALAIIDTLDILNALLDRGADPTFPDFDGISPLMHHVIPIRVDMVNRLLRDARVRATVDKQDGWRGYTALHYACNHISPITMIPVIQALLQAGASQNIVNKNGQKPFALYGGQGRPFISFEVLAFRQRVADTEKTSLLVKARRIGFVSRGGVAPSYLQGRVLRGLPLPQVELQRVRKPSKAAKGRNAGGAYKVRNLVAFLIGMDGGPKGEGMPRDVFSVVLSCLMPSWDPLLRGDVAGPLLQG